MKSYLKMLAAVLLFGPTAGCGKKSTTTDKTNRPAARHRSLSQTTSCKPFCRRLNRCAEEIATALVSDLPQEPRTLFKGKLMARYKNTARCVADCERAEKSNPGRKSALAMCSDSQDCKSLAACLHKMALERRKKIPSAQKDRELKVKGARRASKIMHQEQPRKGVLKPGGPQDNGKKVIMKNSMPRSGTK